MRYFMLNRRTLTLTGAPASGSFNMAVLNGKHIAQIIVDPTTSITYTISIEDELGQEVWRRESHVGDFNETGVDLPVLTVQPYTFRITGATTAEDVLVILIAREE